MAIYCEVCGREIEFEESMWQMESGECLCQENGAACLRSYMLEHITATEIDECFNHIDFKEEKERFRQGGLSALNEEDMELLIEWYRDNFAYNCENDEPDEATLRRWEDEKSDELATLNHWYASTRF